MADLPLRDRSLIVALVVLVHALLLWFLATMPSIPNPVHHEMSVSIAIMPNPPQAAPVEPEPKPEPVVKPKQEPVVKPKPDQPRSVQPTSEIATPVASAETDAPAAESSSAPPQPVNASPSLPGSGTDREPDYQAAYLNNPVPAYPMVARRMGWQGRVVLNVEVLASGLPGQVKLHQSSGHDVLDNAALQAVRGWRFAAARQGGQVVSKWFLVPIPFVLKED